MKYTRQELRWICDLADKAALEAAEQMKECDNASGYEGFKALAELRRDNMQDLRDKTQTMIERDIARNNRNAR